MLARIDAEKEAYLEELKDYIRIPSISTDPAYRDDVLPRERVPAGQDARGRPHGRERSRPRPSAGLRRVAGRAGQADGPLLRPLRRAAGRPGRALAQPAVRAHGRGGQAGGARRHGRQGAVLRPPQGRGGDARRARQPAGQRQVPGRGRGGGGRAGDRPLRARRTAASASRRRRGDLGLLSLRAGAAVAGLRPQGARLHGDPGHRPEPGPALRHVRRRGDEPAQRPGLDRRQAARREDGEDPDPRLLRRRAAAARTGSARSSRPCPSTRRSTATSSA